MVKTPLEKWIIGELGIPEDGANLACTLEAYRFEHIRETLHWIWSRSSFYREKWSGLDLDAFRKTSDLSMFPLISAEDLKREGQRMVCVSQKEIARIITLTTSGTTDLPKRIFLTEEDQERTVVFFHYGMTTMTDPGDRVLILMPGIRLGSVGDLLSRGLARFGAEGVVHGVVDSLSETWDRMSEVNPAVIVGLPRQVGALVKYGKMKGFTPPGIRNVLLSADYVPPSLVDFIKTVWGCGVHEHYGMTETCLGGGVSCSAFEGYHMRETDLFIEIIDPDTGLPVQPGTQGEIVITTLRRRGMPLIRYRTGDISRFIPDPCPCDSILSRLDRVRGRYVNIFRLKSGKILSGMVLDDILLSRPQVFDYTMELSDQAGKDVLELNISGTTPSKASLEHDLRDEILRSVKTDEKGLTVRILFRSVEDRLFTGAHKGIFRDLRAG